MKKIFSLLSLIIPIILFSETHIPEGNVNGIWTSENSPYIIDGEISIQTEDLLTIEPGVEVIFSNHYKFNIYGRLLAEGTESDSIFFTAENTVTGWYGLRFSNTDYNGQDSSKVVYCKLNYGIAEGTGFYENMGGAIFCNYSSYVLIDHCSISDNSAEMGGGIFCYSSSPTIKNSVISNNSADYGGGIECYFFSQPNMNNVTISNNSATQGGGFFCKNSSDATLNNVIIEENSADYGGGFYCFDSSPLVTDCYVLENNAEHDGGGIHITENSEAIFENVLISGNTTLLDGGGVFCSGNSTPVFNNVTISNNSVPYSDDPGGAGFCCWGASPILNNATIINNTTMGSGGGISCVQNSNLYINGGIIKNNFGRWRGGGIFVNSATINLSGVTISENTTENSGGGIYVGYYPEVIFDPVNRCNIYFNLDTNGNFGNDICCYYNIECNVIVDTFTVIEPTEYHCYPLENFTFDIQNGMVEPVNADLYVNPEGNNSNSGLTPDEPLRNIFYALQKIIGDESNPVSIFLANGIYSLSQTGEFFPVICKDYVNIIGENRENTILDAEETNRVILSREVTLSVRNLTVKNGQSSLYQNGGGIFMDDSNVEFENLLITSNNSNCLGGGIYCAGSSPIIINVRIENNNANGFNGFGGGVFFNGSNPVLSSVSITNNYAGSGSGIVFYESNPVFDAQARCNIFNNSSEINYGNDIFLSYYHDNIDVFIDTFTVYDPTAIQINYPGYVSIDIQNSIIPPIDADLFVNPTGSDENSGLTPDDPIKTISFAMNSIVSNEDDPKNIYLDEGIYSTSNTGEQFPLSGKDNVQIIGENRETSIIDGEGNKGLLLLNTVQDFALKNMQLKNGNAQDDYYYQYDDGGAISTRNSVLYFENLIISNNIAHGGGGISNWGSEIEISRTDFIDNLSASAGGGISSSQSNIKLNRVLFYNNTAHSGTGAGICIGSNSDLEIVNCTFFSNEAPSYYGAIYTRNSNTVIVNSILWNDLNNELCIFSAYNEQSTLTITNSNIEGGEDEIYIYGDTNTINWLENNIDTDPIFADTLNGNFNLTENSPCIDTGTAFFEWNDEIIIDLSEDEYFGISPDMGAFEYYPVESDEINVQYPIRYFLSQNYPNPFHPFTTISYSIPKKSDVYLNIYNIKGQKVKTLIDEKQEKGFKQIIWDGTDNNKRSVSSGIYFYRLQTEDYSKIRKMILIR